MDADLIRDLEPRLAAYLEQFEDCFDRRDTRLHLPVYVRGQLSALERKSVEPIALNAGVPVRTLQQFVATLKWNEDRLRTRVAEIVVRDHADEESVGILDETGWVKKGVHTPGVQRQYCGSVGKQENSIITVHLGYAAGDFHCLLDGDLFLPESWDADRQRCHKAGIPDEVVYRPKTEIALELYDRALAHGVRFAWLTFDEWYGGKRPFLRALIARQQKFVAEIPKNFTAWITPPKITNRPFRRGKRGSGRKTPRLKEGSTKPRTVEWLAKCRPQLAAQRWRTWRIKDTHKGPLVWHAKHATIHIKDSEGLPEGPFHLLVCTHALTREVKYFLSNAPTDTPAENMLRVAFTRWRIERCFQDGKGKVGLDHWEGRCWLGLKRHLILTAVSYLFLAQTCHRLRGEKSGVDRLPGAEGNRCDHCGQLVRPARSTARPSTGHRVDRVLPPSQRPSPRVPYTRQDRAHLSRGDTLTPPPPLRPGHKLAL